ncbi:MAG: Rid family hydrolase [Hyphomonadaceae bacterium]|nr:Rid family hydrolase [Hyphomonadaceae bacterium]
MAGEDTVTVPGPNGGEAVYVDQAQKAAHDRWGFAGAYRAGDYVYLSGVVAGASPEATLDEAQFRSVLEQTFQRADQTLHAAGSGLHEVVEITSYHVWDSPAFAGGKMAHMEIVAAVKAEYLQGPDPAWTGIGVSDLLPPNGLVEIRMIAYSPK